MYRIERINGQAAPSAATWDEAVRIAEELAGQPLHQGSSDYAIDWTDEDGAIQYGDATDFWCDEQNASREMSVPADVVIVKTELS